MASRLRLRFRRRRARTGGQALIEFALVAPIFLLVMFSIFELGRAVFYTQVLDSAARDAVRYAIVNGFQSLTCASGPLPPKGAVVNSCDPDGSQRVIPLLKSRAVGVVDTNGPGFVAHVKWCDADNVEAGISTCGLELPCSDWTTVGDGDNGRGQIAAVCITYSYASLFKVFLPVPDFTVSARSDLVVNS